MKQEGKTMDKTINLTTLAAEYRLPLRTCPEELEVNFHTVLDFEKENGQRRILVAGYFYDPDGKSWIAAVYEFTNDDETTCEDSIGVREISAERFSTNGNAIAWAIQNA